ncbi:DUF3781 domain-containing protein [Miniphocaeibacter massiliensis]|uniref:DUF3781 domain-containing protein n=1 Tax=Miniphocaeibacter massiliensis TaxID=2041841 RepID=UPI000C1C3E8D|nr:DUF3781 domain-containing protein [Miniphocaeibacter massiliensis]
MEELINNIEKLHTTRLGVQRLKRNLSLNVEDVVSWCKEKIINPKATMERKGKNWYIYIENYKITVNASSYTIITAHIF